MFHDHDGKNLCGHLLEREGRAAKRVYVLFTEARENDAMAFVEYQGRTPFSTMKVSLWRQSLGGAWAPTTDGI